MKQKYMTYDPLCGTHIKFAAKESIALAKKHGVPVHFQFNGVKLIATGKKSPVTIEREYDMICSSKHEKYRCSKKGQADAARRKEEVAQSQSEVDNLVALLPGALGGVNSDGVITILARLSVVGDDVGVKYDHAALCALLEKAGYTSNAHVGKAPAEFNTRKIMAEYIIGQCINCLKTSIGLHPVTESFAQKYFALR